MVDIELIRNESEKAIELASSLGLSLDYARKSVLALEGLLEALRASPDAPDDDSEAWWTIACMFGAYLGETMLRNEFGKLGFIWSEDDDGEPCLVRKKPLDATASELNLQQKLLPITRVYKRLLNGPSDGVLCWYDTVLGMAQNS